MRLLLFVSMRGARLLRHCVLRWLVFSRCAVSATLPRSLSPFPSPSALLYLSPHLRSAQADMESRKMRERLAKDAYDSDEEGSGGGGGFGGGQRVQCAQQ